MSIHDLEYVKSICSYMSCGIPKIVHQIWINENGREMPEN